MEKAGIHLDCYRLGEITGKIAGPDGGPGDRASTSWPARRSTWARRSNWAGCSSSASGWPGSARPRPATPPTPRRSRACASSHPIVGTSPQPPGTLQAHVHLPARAAAGRRPGDRAAAHHLPPDGGGHRPALVERPEPAEHPRAHGAGRADTAVLHAPSRATCSWSPTTRRSSCTSWPTCRGEPALLEAFARRARTSTRRTAAEVFGMPADEVDDGPPPLRQSGQLRHHVRHLGLRAQPEPGDRPGGGGGLHPAVLRADAAGEGLHRGDHRDARGARDT